MKMILKIIISVYVLQIVFVTLGLQLNIKTASFLQIRHGEHFPLYLLSSLTLSNKIECCATCLTLTSCTRIAVQKKTGESKRNVLCNLYSHINDTGITELIINSSIHVLNKVDLSAITISEEVTTSVPYMPKEAYVDLVEDLEDQCTHNSDEDFALITHGGIYFYDTLGDLVSRVCRFEPNATNVFSGYNDLPDVTMWDAVMNYQRHIDVYTGYMVYRWHVGNSKLTKDDDYPKNISDHIQDVLKLQFPPSSFPSTPAWAINRRDITDRMLYFYDRDDSKFYLYFDFPTYEFSFKQIPIELIDDDGNDLNLFKLTPADTVAMATYDKGTKFVLIRFTDLMVFTLDEIGQMTQMGSLILTKITEPEL